MNSRRVKFTETNIVHDIPIDKNSVNARSKFTRIRPTKYDPHNCEICKISCNSKSIYDIHTEGKKHKRALEKLSELKFPCDLCSQKLNDYNTWITHLSSHEHRIAELNILSSTTCNLPRTTLNKINRCDICDLDCGSNIILQSHLTGAKHKRKLKQLNMEKLAENKDPKVYCEICEICLEPNLMMLHKQSNKHKKVNVKEIIINPRSKSGMEFCGLCDQSLSGISDAVDHYNSENHLKLVKNNENSCWCNICKITLPDESLLEIHLKGFRHYRILNREECISKTGTYKEKMLYKRMKQKELRVQYEKEKLEQF